MGATFTKPPSLADCMPVGPAGPLLYEKEYHHLGVDAGAAGRFFVDIHKYRNNEMNDDIRYETRTAENECYFPLMRRIRLAARGDEAIEGDPKDKIAVIRRTPDEMPRQVYWLSDQFEYIEKQRVYDAFTGKGSPEDLALALRLAIRFGLVAPNTNSLKDYCDKYIGLDCSAFVCNYAISALGKKYDKANKGARTFRDPASERRERLRDIKALDVLAWAYTNHVAIIHSVQLDYFAWIAANSADTDLSTLECTVVESNVVKGLTHSNYQILSVDANRVFTVKRPDEKGVHKVYIRPLP